MDEVENGGREEPTEATRASDRRNQESDSADAIDQEILRCTTDKEEFLPGDPRSRRYFNPPPWLMQAVEEVAGRRADSPSATCQIRPVREAPAHNPGS
jgi:hypothetical protein